MDIKGFFTKNWLHFAVIGFIFIIAAIFFKPQLDGYGLKQHDVVQWKGMAQESDMYRLKTGEEPLWTNSMFGGMPTTQISLVYEGNVVKKMVNGFYRQFPPPIGMLLLHLIGFYIMALFLRINPLLGLIGGIAFSFASYEIIIMQAGHLTKVSATAFLAPTLGAFIYAYKSRKLLGIAFASLFMALELAVNHVQVTYYFIFVLGFVGLYFLYEAIKEKQFASFLKITGGLLAGFMLSFVINMGNILLTNDYAKHTIRGGNDLTISADGKELKNNTSGLDKDYITRWSYGRSETFTLLSPNVKGGGSFPITDSQFESDLENADIDESMKSEIGRFGAYWGEQPFTSGPVYIGAVVILLALLGIFFLKNQIKWALFAVTILAIALSWGKNFMGLTDFFIDYVPGYNKFRTVTIILILVELCVPIMGILFLQQLIKERETMKTKLKPMAMVMGGFFLFVLILKFVGLGDHYLSSAEETQLAGMEVQMRKQISEEDPAVIQQQIGDAAKVEQFINQRMTTYEDQFDSLKTVRSDIFHSSMNRTLLFIFFMSGAVLLFLYVQMPSLVFLLIVLGLVTLDVVPISYQYLGDQTIGESDEYKYWEEADLNRYPLSATAADLQILDAEIQGNPSLAKVVQKGEQEGKSIALEEDLTGLAKQNAIDSYKFSALNFATNYRVFDLGGGFQSSRVSYFHKSLGGYHGAKLRNINNLMDFHLSKMNEKVYDMLNVKYFIQSTEQGQQVIPRPNAMGNAWFVKTVETHATPNDEIRALGSKFKIQKEGTGQLLLNGQSIKNGDVYGSESLRYVLSAKDTVDVKLRNDMRLGDTAIFVMDARGQMNHVPPMTLKADSLNSFRPMATMIVTEVFEPMNEAVMLDSQAEKLSAKKFSGEGTIEMVKYGPRDLVYKSNSKEKQLAIFSEIYYNDGWKAYVDGKEVPILKADYLLRAIEVPAGQHKIEFKFDLPMLGKANTWSFIASLVLILGTLTLVFLEIKKRMQQKTSVEKTAEE